MSELKGQDFKSTDRPTAKRIRRLVEMQDCRCALTGIRLDPDDANLDHIMPIGSGGKHQMDNVQVVHKTINHMKSAMTQDEFIEWCRLVTEHADRDNG